MADSGAVVHLSGDLSVRAAHSFPVTWLAFFGLLGVGIVLLVLALWLARALVNAWRFRGISGLGFALAASTVIAGLAGVILESPFGYMTFVLGTVLSLHEPDDDEFETRATTEVVMFQGSTVR